MKMIHSLKVLGAAAALGLTTLAATAPASAQSLSDVLDRVRQDSAELSAENRARLQQFEQARQEQANILAGARNELANLEARGRELSAIFDANEEELGGLQAELETQAGDFSELLGQFRTAAGETMPQIRESFANFQYPGRVEKLSEISQARTLPTRTDLDSLPKAILQEMIAQSEVTNFTANVSNIGSGGENLDVDLMRVGVFTAATTDGTNFVEVVTDSAGSDPKLVAFGQQPRGEFSGAMSRLINAGEGQIVRAPVDPSKGDLFGILGDLPGLGDRLGQGGPVGFLIFYILLPIGVALALFKIVSLFLMGNSMRSTAKVRQAGTGNPLARVFETYEQNKGEDLNTLELKLDETILKETPKIERFNEIVKVLAAVAPLLGLLGTVIGMIITFTAITIYGAGDPQLMAGGISTALVTTVLGLVAAIPLILLHAVASAMARSNQQVLDEQAAGLVAERAEASARGMA
ncbi:MAG: MotA/TolQ/ExbB proton channel family protein [Pseudomonadota bacterium]